MGSPPDDSTLRARLRDAGLRATRPRVDVLGLLHGAGAPRTHAEVVDALDAMGWDRATLYRNLVDMAEAGLLRRVDLGDHVWRFELASGAHALASEDHPHFLCTACGDVSCLPDLSPPVGAEVPVAVQQGSVAIQVRGLCDRCIEVRP